MLVSKDDALALLSDGQASTTCLYWAIDHFDDLDFDHFFLQPLDDADLEAHTRAAVKLCLRHPQWQLSLQTHKILGI